MADYLHRVVQAGEGIAPSLACAHRHGRTLRIGYLSRSQLKANGNAMQRAALLFSIFLLNVGCTERLRRLGETIETVLLGAAIVATLLGVLSWRRAWRARPSVAPGQEGTCLGASLSGMLITALPAWGVVKIDGQAGWLSVALPAFMVVASLGSVGFVGWSTAAWVSRRAQ